MAASTSSETFASRSATTRRASSRDDGVGLLVRAGEDRVEGLFDRVREDERPAHHCDAEDDRDRSESRAELACGEAAKRDASHCSVNALSASRISDCDEGPSSFTIRPSARKRMRSAIVAAPGIVRDHHRRLAVSCRRRREGGRGSRRTSASRGCPSARRRRATVGSADERTRDCDALLLAAGQLGRTVRPPVGETGRVEQFLEPLPIRLLACDRERQRHVLLCGEHREEVEELEDEADVASP